MGSRELKAYVQGLEAGRGAAAAAALAALGAERAERAASFGEAGSPSLLGDVYTSAGKRLAVVAQVAGHFGAYAALAKQGSSLRRIAERPRAHPVPIRVCGVRSCPAAAGASVSVRPVVVELAPGERLGEPLTLAYDFWWAQVTYTDERSCASR